METSNEVRGIVADFSDRLIWNNPVEIVAAARVPAGARVAEIGCGTGWFTFEIEKAVRPRGMVFALDMQPAMLQILETKRENWERILTLPCRPNEFELDNGEVDLVFHANVLHECREPELHLREVNRVLKHGGRFVVIEWHPGRGPDLSGPVQEVRLGPEAVRSLVIRAGFEVDGIRDAGPFHYALQAVKL